MANRIPRNAECLTADKIIIAQDNMFKLGLAY